MKNDRKDLPFYLAKTPRTMRLDDETAVALAEAAQVIGLNEPAVIKTWALWMIQEAARAIVDNGRVYDANRLTLREMDRAEWADSMAACHAIRATTPEREGTARR